MREQRINSRSVAHRMEGRRAFLGFSSALVASAAWGGAAWVGAEAIRAEGTWAWQVADQEGEAVNPGRLFAYIGTFSSPLKDTLPTQVDLPPGNGRGIHIYEIDRENGQGSFRGCFDLGTSPSCLTSNRAGTWMYSANETDRREPPQGADASTGSKHGTVSAFRVDRQTGMLQELNTVLSGGGSHLRFVASEREVSFCGELLWWIGRRLASACGRTIGRGDGYPS